MPGLSDVVHPVVRLDRSATISAIVFLIAAGVALYPAVKAATLEPVAAIRGIADGRGRARHRGSAAPSGVPVFMLIAGRNLLGNRKRSLITVGGTSFAIVAYVFLYGYLDGFGEQIVDNATRYVTGHAQLERPGFRRDLAPELSFADAGTLLAALSRMPAVQAAAPRVQAQALASSASRSEGIRLLGVDPALERQLTIIDRAMVQGRPLEPGADRDIVIGRQLAEKLGLRLGENRDYSAIPGLTGMAYPRLLVGSIAGPGLALFLGSVAASLHPALRAARHEPTAAIRHL
jgi:ABC-type lipoprotein release transport system permease subunit